MLIASIFSCCRKCFPNAPYMNVCLIFLLFKYRVKSKPPPPPPPPAKKKKKNSVVIQQTTFKQFWNTVSNTNFEAKVKESHGNL